MNELKLLGKKGINYFNKELIENTRQQAAGAFSFSFHGASIQDIGYILSISWSMGLLKLLPQMDKFYLSISDKEIDDFIKKYIGDNHFVIGILANEEIRRKYNINF